MLPEDRLDAAVARTQALSRRLDAIEARADASSIIGRNQSVDGGTYHRAVQNAAKGVPYSFIKSLAGRIERAYDAGEPPEMIAAEIVTRYEQRPGKSARELSAVWKAEGRFDAWDESDHPRDEGGKFSEGAGGGASEPAKKGVSVGQRPGTSGHYYDVALHGEKIGEITLGRGGEFVDRAELKPGSQGQGLAQHAYNQVEKMTGKRLVPSPLGLSEQATSFWKKRLARMPADEAKGVLERAREIGRDYGLKEEHLDQRLGPLERQDAQVRADDAGRTDSYHDDWKSAHTEALAQARQHGKDMGIEKWNSPLTPGKKFRVFGPLPKPQNRYGFEARAEVVTARDAQRADEYNARLDAAVGKTQAMARRLDSLEHRQANRALARSDASANWDESKHKRGQPGNAGQFGPGGGGAAANENKAEQGKPQEAKQGAAQAKPQEAGKAEPAQQQAPAEKGKATAARPAKKTGMEGGERPPFPEEEVAKLPKTAPQPWTNWDEAHAKADEALVQFSSMLGEVSRKIGLSTEVKSPEDLTDEHIANDKSYLFIAPNKSEGRATAKVKRDYKSPQHPDGDWRMLKDMVRATITVNSVDQVRDAIKAVEEAGLKLATKPKDKFTTPTPEGYRDVNTLVALPNGTMAELQYHLKPILQAKNEGHDAYARQQKLMELNGSEEPDETWSPEDSSEFFALRAQQRKIYDAAWQKATGADI